jgi:hypothetical protein
MLVTALSYTFPLCPPCTLTLSIKARYPFLLVLHLISTITSKHQSCRLTAPKAFSHIVLLCVLFANLPVCFLSPLLHLGIMLLHLL